MNNFSYDQPSSSKRRENGDGSTNEEPPLKKAYFAWQIKRRYNRKANRGTFAHNSESSSETDSDYDEVARPQQNLKKLGNYLMKNHDYVKSQRRQRRRLPSRSPSPIYATFHDKYAAMAIKYKDHPPAPPPAPPPPPRPKYEPITYYESQELLNWQDRQHDKACVDNTINRVLESWIASTTRPTTSDNLTVDNNVPARHDIEDAGIMMAISAHGLQKSTSSINTIEEDRMLDHENSDLESFCLLGSLCIPSDNSYCRRRKKIYQYLPPEQSIDQYSNASKANESIERQATCSEIHVSYDISGISNEHKPKSKLLDENDCSNADATVNDTADFLDAAVTFAIQGKGLTPIEGDTV